jgi:hypothetical protein
LCYFIESLATKHGVRIEVTELLLEQAKGLALFYGKDIPKEAALRVISQQIELTKTGHIREPVDIVEFIESPEYMNQGAYVRPAIMDHLYELHGTGKQYFEVVLGGGIGIGKNYFADNSLAFDLYKLSCLYSPQAYYELAVGSSIILIHQSKTLKLARKVVFEQFGARLDASGYFPKHFSHDPMYKAEMRFPHNITVMPISSADTAALGMNVFGGVIDEMNFMQKTKSKKKKALTGEEEYDQAKVLYNTIIRRMESRFDRLGVLPGKLYLVSSANYKGDFIDRKEKEAKTNPHIFVMHMAQWESFMNKDGTLNKKKYCGKLFFVRVPSKYSPGSIYDSNPPASLGEEDKIMKVPVEHREAFDSDLLGSLRDIAGVAIAKTNKFLDEEFIEKSFAKYITVYGKEQAFAEPIVTLSTKDSVESLLNLDFLRRLSGQGPFAAHIDLALTNDAAGVAIGHPIGSIDIGSRTVFDPQIGEFVKEAQGRLPVFGIPGVLQVLPPTGGEIELNMLRQLVGVIADFIPLYWLTMDRHQSASTLQYFRSRGVAASIQSLDRTPDPYIEYKFALKESRVYIAEHQVVMEESMDLEQDFSTGKIDHTEEGSKDVSDAIAGVVYKLSNQKVSYAKRSEPTALPLNAPLKSTTNRDFEGERPSSGRDPLY